MITQYVKKTRSRCIWSEQSGSQIVELALTLPVLRAFIYGVMECGRVVFTYAAVNFAAEEATRYATVNYNASITDIENIAKDRLILIKPERITSFNVLSGLDASDQTKLVTVEIFYKFPTDPADRLGLFQPDRALTGLSHRSVTSAERNDMARPFEQSSNSFFN